MLTLSHIRKSFGTTVALDDVSLTIAPGEVAGIIGENGAGKTTLMRVIAGEIAPDAGSVQIDGAVGFVHQHFMLVNEFTVAENIGLVCGLKRDPAEVIRESGIRLESPERLVRDLSVGEKAKLELIKASARRPRILILDEPTSVLTPDETAEIFAVTRRLAAEGTSVLLISHKIREVLSVATRTVVMRRGRIVGENLTADQMAASMVEVGPGSAATRRRFEGAGEPVHSEGNLSVFPGEIVAIIGVAGNGQTELAEKLRDSLPRAIAAHIPEDRTRDGLIAEMSIAENIALATGLRGANARAQRLIAAYRMRAESPRQRAGSLSGGNQQKLLLARELDRQPEIVVAAEPTRGLDVESTRFVHDELRDAAGRGAAILLITSDLDEAFSLAGAVHVIFRGRLSERLTPEQAAARAGRLMAGLE